SFAIWRHPRSPLYPYTTLFRSLVGRVADHHIVQAPTGNKAEVIQELIDLGHPLIHGLHQQCPALFWELGKRLFIKGAVTQLPGRDRKSTRLNSSHVKISYAVFC